MNDFFQHLEKHVRGEVRYDPIIRTIYSVDASIYEVEPLGVVYPVDKEDLITTLKIAAEHQIPVTARGAATGITGSCLGKGLIVDTSKHLNKILEINIEEEYAIVEPGVVQDRLNDALAPFGYRLGPDTSTGNRATIGGMLANNSAGARSLYYGRMIDHVQEVELVLAGGYTLQCCAVDEETKKKKRQQGDREGIIYREIDRVLTENRKAIEKHFPHIPRHVSGYNLDLLLEKKTFNLKTAVQGGEVMQDFDSKSCVNLPSSTAVFRFNLSTLIAGSEGTLGIATKIKVAIAKKPLHTGICILHIDNLISSLQSVEAMLAHNPLSLEMIDDKILDAARFSPTVKNKLRWLKGHPKAVFVAEFQGTTQNEVIQKLDAFTSDMKTSNVGHSPVIITDLEEMKGVWEVRKAGLGLLLSKRSYSRAIAFIEDISVAPQNLASFIDKFTAYIKSIGKDAGIYGHIGSGCMHIRPYIDLRQKEELSLMQAMMEKISTIVLDHGGAMSGEHGDGLIRSWLNEKMFGNEVYHAFKDIKAAFDPLNLMNPGKIVNGTPLTQDLRLSPESKNISIPTFLDFSNEGGFELAADMCNGNGQCRKMENVMCPSFQASGDEYHTTRARAESLRAIIHGKHPKEEFTGKALYDVLDLCIECKGCQRECPSQVDMAKMKSEFLYQYQEKNGYSLRNRIFGHLHKINRFVSPFATIFNALGSSSLSKSLLRLFGITPKRSLPHLAKETFSAWFSRQRQEKREKQVVLFNDTYTEFNEPDIGKSAYTILTALGYEVILETDRCCGRPMISKGMLKEAKAKALELMSVISSHPMIVLEPSCLSAFKDDYKGLIGNNEKFNNCLSIEEFLQQHLKDGQLPLNFIDEKQEIWIHGHCHQKALLGTSPALNILRSIPGLTVHEIVSGCCGMAGSFGYETEHYDFSMKIGELHLLPAVRQIHRDAIIIANGFSCRSQISHGTDRQAVHSAQVIASRINGAIREPLV